MEGKGLLVNGGVGCVDDEKSKGAGWVSGMVSNQTSLYNWMSRLRKGLADGVLSWFRKWRSEVSMGLQGNRPGGSGEILLEWNLWVAASGRDKERNS